MNAIEIRNISKQQGKYFTLRIGELTLPGGCIMGLLGKNGAGKSTLIRCLLGMTKPDGGSVSLLGRGEVGNDRSVLEDVGVVLAGTMGLPGMMNAKQLGKLMRGIYRNWDGARYEQLLTRFGLQRNSTLYDKMSLGTRVKVNLAIALSHGARLLILDEATNGLDVLIRDEVIDILLDFTRDEQHSVLIASHMVEDLEKVCDYIAILREGELVMCEGKDALIERYGLIQMPADDVNTLPGEAIVAKKVTPFGAQVLVERDKMVHGVTPSPVSLEQLFLMLEKEASAS